MGLWLVLARSPWAGRRWVRSRRRVHAGVRRVMRERAGLGLAHCRRQRMRERVLLATPMHAAGRALARVRWRVRREMPGCADLVLVHFPRRMKRETALREPPMFADPTEQAPRWQGPYATAHHARQHHADLARLRSRQQLEHEMVRHEEPMHAGPTWVWRGSLSRVEAELNLRAIAGCAGLAVTNSQRRVRAAGAHRETRERARSTRARSPRQVKASVAHHELRMHADSARAHSPPRAMAGLIRREAMKISAPVRLWPQQQREREEILHEMRLRPPRQHECEEILHEMRLPPAPAPMWTRQPLAYAQVRHATLMRADSTRALTVPSPRCVTRTCPH
ncbi:hypothetical protein [Myxococcus landrumensis]|uniref:Uncharacterized protein n=1 Tax=Myxococcus landrumensis TaxID=2813577 RepID=A0ABX7NP72_9BACT|nr:hypothetical protein [Myxococcus landrumus]QSQ18008.1 hypothetical protein JY572_19160 [Myxococcus landrumus]